jgi:hypothetical protein
VISQAKIFAISLSLAAVAQLGLSFFNGSAGLHRSAGILLSIFMCFILVRYAIGRYRHSNAHFAYGTLKPRGNKIIFFDVIAALLAYCWIRVLL